MTSEEREAQRDRILDAMADDAVHSILETPDKLEARGDNPTIEIRPSTGDKRAREPTVAYLAARRVQQERRLASGTPRTVRTVYTVTGAFALFLVVGAGIWTGISTFNHSNGDAHVQVSRAQKSDKLESVVQLQEVPPGGASQPSEVNKVLRPQAATQGLAKANDLNGLLERYVSTEPIIRLAPSDENLPDEKLAHRGTAPSFRWPARGRIVAGFGANTNGRENDGINLEIPQGTEIRAAEDGVVAYAGNLLNYGNLILIRHSNGFVTLYAHASEIMVNRNDPVQRGQVIAKSGQTGTVTSPQLHFEIRQGSAPVDPMQFLPNSKE